MKRALASVGIAASLVIVVAAIGAVTNIISISRKENN